MAGNFLAGDFLTRIQGIYMCSFLNSGRMLDNIVCDIVLSYNDILNNFMYDVHNGRNEIPYV